MPKSINDFGELFTASLFSLCRPGYYVCRATEQKLRSYLKYNVLDESTAVEADP